VSADDADVINLQTELEDILRGAVIEALGSEYAEADLLLVPAKDPKFGDYQANLAMGLAKRVGRNPREIAQQIAGVIPLGPRIDTVDVAGPGFINLRLVSSSISDGLAGMLGDDRLGVPTADPVQTVVVDYCAPNMAKEMHIGHIRSTCIGDAIARVLAFLGHAVIRQNHLGDWGTQFGMLVEHLVDTGWIRSADQSIGDLNELYQESKRRFDAEPEFADRARQRVVAMQSGDPTSMAYWRMLIDESVVHMNTIFQRLGVLLLDSDIRAESFYNGMLMEVIDRLDQVGQLAQSQGAKVVYPEGFADRDGHPFPMIVQKGDGGYLYATTDLAAGMYRSHELGADRVIYVVDARQTQHLAMVFAVLRQSGLVGSVVRFDHVHFGTILGSDRTPFKTRVGGTVKLTDVLDEVERRALSVIQDKGSITDSSEQKRVAQVVGIGAVKYADLSNDRIKDYVFDWNRMLSLEGNTAPYLQNAYVRIQAIFRKGEVNPDAAPGFTIPVFEPSERSLGLHLLQLPEVLAAVGESLEPHRLCTYLYELASHFHRFYEHCPVLKAEQATRDGRLALCALAGRTLRLGLELLGIDVADRM